jgi:hypothetical protein
MLNSVQLNYSTSLVKTSLAIFAGFLLLSVLAQSSNAQAKSSGNIDWIFVVDTSKSMRGAASGSQNVFSEVKEQIRQFIHTANNNDTMALYTFDENPKLIKNVLIQSSFDRQDLLDGVGELQAEGNWTYTGDAISKALNRAEVVKDQYTNSTREVVIVLFTDDQEEHAPGRPSKFLRDIPVSKNKYRPFTFLVYLNKKEVPQDLSDFIQQFGNQGSIIKYSSPAEINNLKSKVLSVLLPVVTIIPASLSFGQLEPGSTTDAQAVNIQTTRPVTLMAILEGEGSNGISLLEPTEPITLAEENNHIEFRLKADHNQPETDFAGAIVLKMTSLTSSNDQNREDVAKALPSAGKITFNVKIEKIPLYKKLIKWSPLIFGSLLFLYVLAYVKMHGHPHQVIGPRSWLEGQLIIRKPRLEGVNHTINLSQEKKRKVKLSQLQGGILKLHLEESDAELQTMRKGELKQVNIKSMAGLLYVQEEKIISSELRNGDIIEIGDLELEYQIYQSKVPQPVLEG